MTPNDCCAPCAVTPPVNIPGSSGLNGYTSTVDNFVLPAPNANVVVLMANTGWMFAGLSISIGDSGGNRANFVVVSVNSPTSATLRWLGLASDSLAGTTISAPATVVAVGTAGINAYTLTTQALTVPPAGTPGVTLNAVNTSWMVSGQVVIIGDGTHQGTFQITGILGNTSATANWVQGPSDSATGSIIAPGATISPSAIAAVTFPISVANGGTGATDPAGARANLGAAASGANTDITSLGGLTTPLSVAQGGTGATTIAAIVALFPFQTGSVALVAGTKTINAGITITANSVVLVTCKNQSGTRTGFASYEVPSVSRVVGGPGVGSITINARDDGGSVMNLCTDLVDYLIVK